MLAQHRIVLAHAQLAAGLGTLGRYLLDVLGIGFLLLVNEHDQDGWCFCHVFVLPLKYMLNMIADRDATNIHPL